MLNPKGSNSIGAIIGVRESGPYKLKGKNINQGKKQVLDT